MNRVEDMVDDEQALSTGILERVEHPRIDGFEVVNLPITFDGDYPLHQGPPPDLGADTDAVLASLGYGADEISALRHDAVVATAADDEGGSPA